MKIATIGSGNVGGGLAGFWRNAGHEVQVVGRDGGDVGDADAVLLAVPSGVIAEALEGVSGLQGKTLIDATNLIQGELPEAPSRSRPTSSSRPGPALRRRSTPSSRAPLRPARRAAGAAQLSLLRG